jgi:hypothetical protein
MPLAHVELLVDSDGRVDQRQVRERLREVAELSPVDQISSEYAPRWLP